HLDYEFVQDQFKPLERLRNIEFNRDWSLSPDAPAVTEHLISGSFQLNDKRSTQFKYDVTDYNRSDNYNGLRQSVTHNMRVKGWRVADQFTITNINSTTQKGSFIRPTIDISKQFPHLKNIQ